jgi:hypothetical protein
MCIDVPARRAEAAGTPGSRPREIPVAGEATASSVRSATTSVFDRAGLLAAAGARHAASRWSGHRASADRLVRGAGRLTPCARARRHSPRRPPCRCWSHASAAPPDSAGAFVVEVDGQRLPGRVVPTGGGAAFAARDVGERVLAPGHHTIRVRRADAGTGELMRLRRLVLTPTPARE